MPWLDPGSRPLLLQVLAHWVLGDVTVLRTEEGSSPQGLCVWIDQMGGRWGILQEAGGVGDWEQLMLSGLFL